jgi:hypothetical protein
MVCFVRLGNTAFSGRTRVFIDRLTLRDSVGYAGKLAETVWLATWQTEGGSIARNVEAGTQELVAFGFLGVPIYTRGGTFGMRLSPGWSADRYDVTFPNAIGPAP